MLATAQLIGNHQHFITAYVQKFRQTGNVFLLLKAMMLVFRQGRGRELLYGAYYDLFHGPSRVSADKPESGLITSLKEGNAIAPQGVLSRQRILEVYGRSFKVAALPRDFYGARTESIWEDRDFILIGEYGEDSRIAHVTSDSCVISEHYRQVPGVRHIHAVEKFGETGEFLVATGDRSKFLDLWRAETREVRFVRRIDRHLAGFTAAIRVNGEYYFGTDFSSRPNWIETLGGTKYFFPRKAYRLHVTDFYAYLDRYIFSINTELVVAGGRKTLSVFDTHTRQFIYCEYWSAEQQTQIDSAA